MRNLSATLKAILAGSSFSVRTLARLDLASGLYRVCDGEDNLVWGGNTYIALGEALVLNPGAQTADGRGQGSTLSLSGSDPALLNTFFNETYRGRNAELALLFFDPATNQPLEEVLLASGKMEVVTHSLAPSKPGEPDKPVMATLTMSLTSASSEMERAGVRTRSDTDQRTHRDSSDGFFRDVMTAGKSEIIWGRDGTSSPVKAAGAVNAGGTNLAGLDLSSLRANAFR
jgi:hypothetical protein